MSTAGLGPTGPQDDDYPQRREEEQAQADAYESDAQLLSKAEFESRHQLREAVHTGRVQLDWFLGPNWPDLVNWDELEMSSECGCVLGQTFGDYWKGIVAMTELSGKPEYFSVEWELATEFADSHGFDLSDQDAYLSYGDLRKLWLEEVGK